LPPVEKPGNPEGCRSATTLAGTGRRPALRFVAFVPLVWCMARPAYLATKAEVRQAVEAA
jgi:hypothetical protein